MKKIINPRPLIDETLIKPFRDMEDVLSLSCVVGDAMERDNVMRPDIKPVSYTHLRERKGFEGNVRMAEKVNQENVAGYGAIEIMEKRMKQ